MGDVEPLGLEHTRWTGAATPCGSGTVISCRDLARTAQLWANDGEWLTFELPPL